MAHCCSEASSDPAESGSASAMTAQMRLQMQEGRLWAQPCFFLHAFDLSYTAALHAHMLLLLQEADVGGGAVEMRFSLPAAASPAMLMLLLAACRELQRAGSFACSSTAVHLMSWELGRAIVAVLRWGHTQLMFWRSGALPWLIRLRAVLSACSPHAVHLLC